MEERTALVALAQQINEARITANGIEATESSNGVYGQLSTTLLTIINLIVEGNERADFVYDSIIDGNTVQQALSALKAEDARYVETENWTD